MLPEARPAWSSPSRPRAAVGPSADYPGLCTGPGLAKVIKPITKVLTHKP
jgi:hypothetical protein